MNPIPRVSSPSRCLSSFLVASALLLPVCGGGGGGGPTGGAVCGGGGGAARTAQTAVLLQADGTRVLGVLADGSGDLELANVDVLTFDFAPAAQPRP